MARTAHPAEVTGINCVCGHHQIFHGEEQCVFCTCSYYEPDDGITGYIPSRHFWGCPCYACEAL